VLIDLCSSETIKGRMNLGNVQ